MPCRISCQPILLFMLMGLKKTRQDNLQSQQQHSRQGGRHQAGMLSRSHTDLLSDDMQPQHKRQLTCCPTIPSYTQSFSLALIQLSPFLLLSHAHAHAHTVMPTLPTQIVSDCKSFPARAVLGGFCLKWFGVTALWSVNDRPD